MSPDQKDDVIRLATEAGVSLALFDGWDGTELALYNDSAGVSRDLETAQRIAREKSVRGDWILDLGNRAFAVPSNQGATLKAGLDGAGVKYETGPQTVPFLKRTRWAVKEHADVLAELAKL